MSGLVVPKIECAESKDKFGRFLIEPLERGFGITIGNALRRVLLGYLPGAAVTRVKIEGAGGQVMHEFSTIPHIREDTLEFLLNVKGIRLKALSGQPGVLTLDVVGPGQVFAADIKPSTDFEIVNPELYLATLDSPEARLRAELEVELGVGYKSAESSTHLPIGTIPIDAVFSPVRKVNFTVSPTHLGQVTTQEQLSLEAWTDGTISPTEALGRSAEILMEQLSPMAKFPGVSEVKVEELALHPGIPDEKYNLSVEQLDLSVRTMNCLRRAGIITVGELLKRGEKELMSLRNFGQKSKEELEERLNTLGLSLSGEAKAKEAEPAEAADLTTAETGASRSDKS